MREEPSHETYRGPATGSWWEGLHARVLGLPTETIMHWTQDPANAKKLSAARKRAALTRAMNRKATKPKAKRVARRASQAVVKVDAPSLETVQHEQKESTATAIAYSHCDAYIQVLADTFGLSRSALADRVGEALREQAARR